MATIKKKERENKCWWECGEIGTLVHHWWEGTMLQQLWKQYQSLKKIKLQLTCDSVILVLGIYYKQLKAGFQRDICILMFIAALSQYVETTQICINRQMDK